MEEIKWNVKRSCINTILSIELNEENDNKITQTT